MSISRHCETYDVPSFLLLYVHQQLCLCIDIFLPPWANKRLAADRRFPCGHFEPV